MKLLSQSIPDYFTDPISTAFFTGRVADTLSIKHEVTQEERKLVLRAASFLEKGEKGHEFMKNFVIFADITDALQKYRMVLAVAQNLGKISSHEDIDKLFSKMKNELDEVVSSGNVDPSRLKLTRRLFSLIKENAQIESFRHSLRCLI